MSVTAVSLDSISLPQNNTPQEIQKMGLDLLDKIKKVYAVIPATAPSVSTNFAPLPQSAAGVGQWEGITAATGAALSLPAGGTWAYYAVLYWNATTNIAYWFAGCGVGGIAAGGTQILGAVVGIVPLALVWRIT